MIDLNIRRAAGNYSKAHGSQPGLVEAFIAGCLFEPPKEEVSESSFEEFWNIYQKKVGKSKSLTCWKKLTEREKQKAIEYAKQYVVAKEKRYRKDPERFLRYKVWEDELIYNDDGNKWNTAEQKMQRVSEAAGVIAALQDSDRKSKK